MRRFWDREKVQPAAPGRIGLRMKLRKTYRLACALGLLMALVCAGCESAQPVSGNHRAPEASMSPSRPDPVFQDYDKGLVSLIKEKWFEAIDKADIPKEVGSVSVSFRIDAYGMITDLQVTESTVSKPLAALCQQAILDSFPYKPWPERVYRKF